MNRLSVVVCTILVVLFFYAHLFIPNDLIFGVKFIVYTTSFLFVIIGVCLGYLWVLIQREQYYKVRAERNILEKEAIEFTITPPGHQVFITRPGRETEILSLSQQIESQRTTPPQIDLPNILDVLDPAQRCLIVGASDSGKSTLLKQIADRRKGKIIVIDPHAYPQKWQECTVAGVGRNYEEIQEALNALVKLMIKRYDEIGQGKVAEMGHEKRTIIIDEWRAIVQNCGKPAQEAIKTLLTESRKAAFSIFVATHSERVKALGIEGEGDLKDGFTIARLSIINGMRSATVDDGNGPIPVRVSNVIKSPEEIFLELINSGLSKNKASVIAFGERNAGNRFKKIKRLLGE